MRDMLCDTQLDVCEATDFTTVFQNLDQVKQDKLLAKEPKLSQSKRIPVGYLGCLAGDFLFVLTELWLLYQL